MGLALRCAPAEGASPAYSQDQSVFDGGGGKSGSAKYSLQSSISPLSLQARSSDGRVQALSGYAAQLNSPPVTQPDSIDCLPGQSVTFGVTNLLANDTDPEQNVLTLLAVTSPTAKGGQVKLQGQSVTYSPPTGFTGQDTFTYSVTDGWGNVVFGLVTVDVGMPGGPGPGLGVSNLGGGRLQLILTGTAGKTYRIEYADALRGADTAWIPLTTGPADSTGRLSFVDVLPPGINARFYRALEVSAGVRLQVQPVGVARVRISVLGSPGQAYTLEYTSALQGSSTAWNGLATRTTDGNGRYDFDDSPPAGTAQRFYRARP